jgi:hypothetical protein
MKYCRMSTTGHDKIKKELPKGYKEPRIYNKNKIKFGGMLAILSFACS